MISVRKWGIRVIAVVGHKVEVGGTRGRGLQHGATATCLTSSYVVPYLCPFLIYLDILDAW